MTIKPRAGAFLASISALALLGNAFAASAQSAHGYDQSSPQSPQGGQYGQGYDQNQPQPGYYQNQQQPGYYQNQASQDQYGSEQGQYVTDPSQYEPDRIAPPQGQYAPPPPGVSSYGGAYDNRTQRYDRDYAGRYSTWASQYCVDRRNNNTVAGAVIGGILGAIVGSNVAERGSRGGGTVVGGVLGATAGGLIGHSASDTRGCPPGYAVRDGAPNFYYDGRYAGSSADYAPAWYHPWIWSGGQWVYHPYRDWYWRHPNYWEPDFHGRRWHDRRNDWYGQNWRE